MEGQRYCGSVKAFKGSFGWIACAEVAEKYNGRDAFLHKNSVNALPIAGCKVSFRLVLDAKGNPKAEDACLEAPAEPADAKAAPKARPAARGELDVRRAALMLTRGEEVLVMREDKEGQIRWSDLGGKIEPGEAFLDCALRELAEEAQGFLSAESLALLDRGLRARYGTAEAGPGPELVTLQTGGRARPHAMAVFRMDCEGVDLEPLAPGRPNAHGVHELRWLSRADPQLMDRTLTRWPLLRALCALRPPRRVASRSRSPRRRQGGGVESEEEEEEEEEEEAPGEGAPPAVVPCCEAPAAAEA